MLATLDQHKDTASVGGGAGDGLGDKCVAGAIGGEGIVEVWPVEVGLVAGELRGLHNVMLGTRMLEFHRVPDRPTDQR